MPVRSTTPAFFQTICAFLLALGALACQPEIGDECQTSVDCSQGGERLCDVTQPGGYCTIFNCEPDGCPEESVCVAFGTQLSTVEGCSDANGLSRLVRSFCMATCGSSSDCRGAYDCLDVGEPGNPWSAVIADGSRKKVCIVPYTAAPPPADRSAEVCTGAGGGAGTGSGGTSGGGGTNGGGTDGGGTDGGGTDGGGTSGGAGESGAGGAP